MKFLQINFEESQIEDRFIVNANIDPNLDRCKFFIDLHCF